MSVSYLQARGGFRQPTTTSVKAAGATGTGVGDDGPAFQRAVNAASGGGVVYVPAGNYLIATAITPVEGVVIVGDGMGATRLIQAGSNRLFARTSGSPYLESFGIMDLSMIGTWLTNQSLGTTSDRQLFLNNFRRIFLRNVESDYCRNIAIGFGSCDEVDVQGCRVTHSARDMMNFSQCKNVKVLGSTFRWGDDNSIAIHTNPVSGNQPTDNIQIAHNFIEDVYGIKTLGLRKGSIHNNQIFRPKSYGIFMQAELGDPGETSEGANSVADISIRNNLILDVVKGTLTGGLATAQRHIYVSSNAEDAQAPIVPGAPPTINLPENFEYQDNNIANSRTGGRNIDITGNTCAQTLRNNVDYSAWGYGLSFSNDGWVDPEIGITQMKHAMGVTLGGALLDAAVHDNKFENLEAGVYLLDTVIDMPGRTGLEITRNKFIRCDQYGIFSALTTAREIPARITGNTFDLDPYFESDRRTNAGANVDGSWQAASTYPACVFGFYWRGILFEDNVCKNFVKEVRDNSDSAYVVGRNTLVGDPVHSKGFPPTLVQTVPVFARYQMEGSDPSNSDTWGKALPQGVLASSTAPTTGLYMVGPIVGKIVGSGSGAVTSGWLVTGVSGNGGGAHSGAWASGQTYAAGLWKQAPTAPNAVYRLVTAGGGTTAQEPVHTSGSVAGADGYLWHYEAPQQVTMKALPNVAA